MNINNFEKFSSILQEIEIILRDADLYSKYYNIDRKHAENEIKAFSEYKDRAALGEKEIREHLLNNYVMILKQVVKLDDNSINEYIDFDNIQNNHVQIIFEMLLEVYDISEIILKHGLGFTITEDDIRLIAKKEEGKINAYFDLTKKLKLLSLFIYSSVYGQDVIDTLQHHNISEIGIIDKDYIYIVFRGNKIYLKFLNFKNEQVILNIQKKTTRNANKSYDETNPTLTTAKNNSSRITVAGFTATPESNLYYNERIFNLSKITLEEMRDKYNTINELIYKILLVNQKGRGSHFVTGSDMGVGKSTFMLAMMEKVPNQWGIGILDSVNELQAKVKYPWKNILTLVECETRTIAKLFEIMLKMARDVLYVGEITKPDEVAELINSSLRLNAGVGATLHSKTPYEVVTNLRNLLMRTEMYNNADVAEADISRGLDLIVHLAKHDNGRIVVDKIVELEYIETDKYIEPKIGSFKEMVTNIANIGQYALLKYLYRKSYRYNTIISYDYQKDIWKPENMFSNEYLRKIERYVKMDEIEELKNTFEQEKKKVNSIWK